MGARGTVVTLTGEDSRDRGKVQAAAKATGAGGAKPLARACLDAMRRGRAVACGNARVEFDAGARSFTITKVAGGRD